MYAWTDGSDYLMHYGILGQKWGIRRFQNLDGSYTEAGKERYGLTKSERNQIQAKKDIEKYGGRNTAKAAIETKYGMRAMAALYGGAGAGVAGLMLASSMGALPLAGIAVPAGIVAGGLVGTFISSKGQQRIAAIMDSDIGHDVVTAQQKSNSWDESDYGKWYNSLHKFEQSDVPKQEPLTTGAKQLQKDYSQSSALKYYNQIGGNNIWNRMANAKDDFEKSKAIGLSVIEQSLRTNTDLRKRCSSNEANAVDNVILDTHEIGCDFPGSISDHEMKMVFEYEKRFHNDI